ncbi:MAG TPA: hypothetical protein VG755_05775 [Nannocystaceae bacterium]|nr:hypothetical protein [Nannocystaceae bacterium]
MKAEFTSAALALVGACTQAHGHADASAEQAVAGVVAPRWERLPTQVVGCDVERLVDPRAHDLFEWRACAGAPECSEAVWNAALVGHDGEIGRRSSVDDDGHDVRVAVRWDSDEAGQAGVFVTDAEGRIALGLRVTTAGACNINAPSIAHGRFGVLVMHAAEGAAPLREGGLLAALDRLEVLAPFELDPLPKGSGPDAVALGTSRWAWRFSPERLVAFANDDGSDARVVAERDASLRMLGPPSATGPAFLFDMFELDESGRAVAHVGRSDGHAPPEHFIAGTADAWVGAARFAHSHIAWLRGLEPSGGSAFARVELWAAPYTDDAGALAPVRIGELDTPVWSPIGAGWGRYAIAGATPTELQVFALADATRTRIALPDGHTFAAAAGLTRDALWIVPELHDSPQRGLLRITL